MTPNFALSLSFEGIRLMHRVTGGWHLVGEAAIDDPDLTGTLARLRQTALALEPAGLRTKLLLPNDQIKYLSLDGTQTSEAEVHAALDGATPYAISDLVIDYNRSGGRTHIAAVARETLAEAEAFATQHRFSPVTFAAVADPFTFNTEVYFGMTEAAPGIIGDTGGIARDAEPVMVIGHASMPTPADLSHAMPLTTQVETPSTTADPAPPVAAPASDPASKPPASQLEAPQTEQPFDEPVLSFGRSAGTVGTASRDAIASTGANTGADTGDGAAGPSPLAPDAAAPLPDVEDVVFASRIPRQPTSANQTQAIPVTPPSAAAPAKWDAAPPAEPQFSRRRDPALAPGAAAAVAETDARHADQQTTLIPVAEPDAPAVPKPIVAAPAPLDAGAAAPAAMAPAAAPRTAAANPSNAGAGKGFTATVAALMARRKAKRAARAAPVPTGIGPIGGKHAQQVGGKPKYLGLMLTLGLLVFLALIALWASTLDEDGIAGLLGFGDDDTAIQLATAPPDNSTAVAVNSGSDASAASSARSNTPSNSTFESDNISDTPTAALEIEPATLTTPIVTTVPGRVLSPGEAERIYAATGVWQRAPRLPFEPEETTLDGLQIFAAAEAVTPLALPRDLGAAAQGIEAPFLAPPNPAPAGTIVARDENGFIVASAQGTVMPNGVLVYARAPQVLPPARPAALVPAAAAIPQTQDPSITETAALDAATPDNATPNTDDIDTDDAVALATAAVAAALAGTAESTDPSAAIAPPLARPDTIAEAAAEQAFVADPTLAGVRPSLRPEGLAPKAPFADPRFAGLRPSLRPEGLGPTDQEGTSEPEETDNTSIEEAVAAASTAPDLNDVIATIAAAAPPSALVNPTRQAIVASPRPDRRPNNFSRVVAAAQSRPQATPQAATQASAPAVASNAAVRPTGSVPQSVAAAATQDNAINLRRVNLIGVYGRPNDRRALIRLTNGRYVKVEVGTSLEGGRVTAIGDSALNYVVRGETFSLQVPSG